MERATLSSTDAAVDAPNTMNSVTTPTPTMSAVAVPAVRRGFRIAFWRARRPVTPRSRATGEPRNADDRTGDERPQGDDADERGGGTEADEGERDVEHAERRADGEDEAPDEEHPADHRPDPGRGHALDRDGPECGERGHPEEAQAGPNPAATVTTMPTTAAIQMLSADTTRPLVGTPNPTAWSSAWSPCANPMPARTPRADAMTPTISVSMNVAVSTCRRVAPSARSKADSRVRCASTTEKVLWMLNVATSIATPLNTMRNAEKKSRKSELIAWTCSSVRSAPVSASVPAGSTSSMPAASWSALVPSAAVTSSALMRLVPPPSSSLGLIGGEQGVRGAAEAVGVAELGDADDGRRRRASGARTVVWSPTSSWPFLAEPRSITTSPSALRSVALGELERVERRVVDPVAGEGRGSFAAERSRRRCR